MCLLLSWFNTNQNAAVLAVITNGTIVAVEFVVGFRVGSITIIADAMHGGVDLITTIMAFVSTHANSLTQPPLLCGIPLMGYNAGRVT